MGTKEAVGDQLHRVGIQTTEGIIEQNQFASRVQSPSQRLCPNQHISTNKQELARLVVDKLTTRCL